MRRPAILDDLLAMPDDGKRYWLMDGEIAEMGMTQRNKVLAADAKGYRIEQTIEKTVVVTGQPGAEDAAKKMAGTVFVFTLDAKFAVKKMEGLDKLLDTLSGDNAEIRKTLAALLTEELYTAGFAEFFRSAPEAPVKLGGKWTLDHTMPLGAGLGSLKVESKFKYALSDEAGDKITWSADATYEPSKADAGLPFKFVGGELKSESFTGQYSFDSKRGRIKTNSTKIKIGGTSTISVNGTEVEMGIRQAIESTTTISDKSPADD